ncbi:MAG: carbonic anhydrase [Stagnimonas sp.]|nr:carbonic anhydrase [Stagnimonas sp.]
MDDLQNLLDNNRRWAAKAVASDPEFFRRLERQQAPDYLWIGCSDSRVPANEIVDLAPGELFVHRNVANVVSHGDANCQSVIQFAVDVLKVEHIMVVGHYGCGGVKMALECVPVGGIADHWLGHVREVACRHQGLIDLEPTDIARNTLMVELNVMEQAINVCASPTVLAAWARGQPVTVHGWVYSLRDGLVRHLDFDISAPENITVLRERAVMRLMEARGDFKARSKSLTAEVQAQVAAEGDALKPGS